MAERYTVLDAMDWFASGVAIGAAKGITDVDTQVHVAPPARGGTNMIKGLLVFKLNAFDTLRS